jgi:hypothetical protein
LRIFFSEICQLKFAHFFKSGITMDVPFWSRFGASGRDVLRVPLTSYVRWRAPLSSDLRIDAKLTHHDVKLNSQLVGNVDLRYRLTQQMKLRALMANNPLAAPSHWLLATQARATLPTGCAKLT